MAKTIKGITVEIEGNATGLGKALEDVNKSIKSTNSELNKVDKALKLDPENTVLLTQKQELLSEAIKETSEKLKTLENVQEEVERQFQSGEIGAEAYRDFQRTVETTKSKLKSLNEESENLKLADNIKEAGNETEETTSETKKLENALGKVTTAAERTAKATAKIAVKVGTEALSAAANVFETYVKSATAAATAIGGLAIKIGKDAVDAYSDYEQLVGGVDTLFKDSSQEIQNYAENAYKTAGLSANEYMETVTSFSASLIQSLDGDTQKAAEYADRAITDMSDNANKMGSDISDIQNAYQGFAKQNYTMLDNLKLGYGGTKEEMQRLLDDAEKISGVKYDISSFSDITEAIHVMQESMGIAGTTAKEAESTISGSISSLKSAGENLLAGFGNADADIEKLCKDAVKAFATVTKNVTPVVENIAKEIPTAINTLIEEFPIDSFLTTFGEIADKIVEEIPSFLGTFNNIVLQIADGIVANMPTVVDSVLPALLTGCTNLVTGLVSHLPTLLPTLAQGAVTLFVGLIDGLNEVIEQLTPMLPDIVQDITTVLIDNMPLLIDGTVTLFTGIIEGLSGALPEILQAVADLAGAILVELAMHLPDIIAAGADMVVAIAKGLVQLFSPISDALSDMIMNINDWFHNKWEDFKEWGSDMIDNFIEGIKSKWNDLKETVIGFGQTIKDYIGFSEPEKGPLSNFHTFAPDMVDLFVSGITSNANRLQNSVSDLAAGIGVGFENEMSHVNAQIQKSLPTSFDTSVNVNANGGVSGAISSAGQALSMANLPQNATFIIQMDGKTCAESTFPYINIMAGAKIKLDNRGLA